MYDEDDVEVSVTVKPMHMSAEVNALFEAFAKAQGEMLGARMTGRNEAFKRNGQASSYATLADVWDAIRPALTKFGIAVVQAPSVNGRDVSITTMLTHASGQWISSMVSAQSKDTSPQAVGSAITYLRRYGLASMTGVVNDVDDDGNAASLDTRRPAPVEKIEPQKATMRQQLTAFQKALETAGTMQNASKVWQDHADLLRGVPQVTLRHFVNYWRSRDPAGPPPIDGLAYPVTEEAA